MFNIPSNQEGIMCVRASYVHYPLGSGRGILSIPATLSLVWVPCESSMM